MAQARLTAKFIFKDERFKRFMRDLKSNMNKVNPILRGLYGTIGIADIFKHFEQESGPSGKWKPRSRATQARYRRIQQGKEKPPAGVARAAFNPENKILQMTGKLKGSILPTNTRPIGRNTILVWAHDPKAGKHDRGEDGELGILPKRKFMWLSNDAKRRMINGLAELVMP